MAKWVATQVAVEIFVDKHPIERGIESDEHGSAPVIRDMMDPGFKIRHRLSGRETLVSKCF